MKDKILVDNYDELIKVKWDGERFGLVKRYTYNGVIQIHSTLLNPREMRDLIDFGESCLKGE